MDEATKAGVEGLLRAAIEKSAADPLVIFVDINLPPSREPLPEKKWFNELEASVEKVSSQLDLKADPFGLIVFTNHPEHYVGDMVPLPDAHTLGVLSLKPGRPCMDAEALRAVLSGAEKYDRIPNLHFK